MSEGLRRLPDIPVPSNFTAGVLRAAQLQSDAQLRQAEPVWRRWHWRVRWLPRIALAAVVLAAGVFSYHRALDVRRTEEWVRPLEVVSSVASLPDAEILRDFDAIRALDRTPAANAGPDEDLLNDLRQ